MSVDGLLTGPDTLTDPPTLIAGLEHFYISTIVVDMSSATLQPR